AGPDPARRHPDARGATRSRLATVLGSTSERARRTRHRRSDCGAAAFVTTLPASTFVSAVQGSAADWAGEMLQSQFRAKYRPHAWRHSYGRAGICHELLRWKVV